MSLRPSSSSSSKTTNEKRQRASRERTNPKRKRQRTSTNVVRAGTERRVERLLRKRGALFELRQHVVGAQLGARRREHNEHAALLLDDAKALDFAKLHVRCSTHGVSGASLQRERERQRCCHLLGHKEFVTSTTPACIVTKTKTKDWFRYELEPVEFVRVSLPRSTVSTAASASALPPLCSSAASSLCVSE